MEIERRSFRLFTVILIFSFLQDPATAIKKASDATYSDIFLYSFNVFFRLLMVGGMAEVVFFSFFFSSSSSSSPSSSSFFFFLCYT